MRASVSGTPLNCSICHGRGPVRPIIVQFGNVEYGHSECGRCHITFDDNVNDHIHSQLSEDQIASIDDEDRYRELFIETSRIATDEGEIYPNFDWDDNDMVKSGVASHVIGSIEAHRPGGVDRFVDVGCGDGFTSRQIIDAYPAASVMAIDPSPMVETLAGAPRTTPYQGILQNAPIEPGSVDVVAVIGSWMLHTDPVDTVRAAFDVLEPGGLLVVDFKNVRSLSRLIAKWALRSRLDHVAGRSWLERNFLNMRFGYHKEAVARLMNEAGFELLEMYGKPPRLLEFGNRSIYQRGVAGLAWRALDRIDRVRGEQAWVHVVCRKPDGTPHPGRAT